MAPSVPPFKFLTGRDLIIAQDRRGQQADHLERQNGSLGLVVADADIQRAAEELVERYGDSALAVAQNRVETLSTSQDQSEINVALRVLSVAEALLFSNKPK